MICVAKEMSMWNSINLNCASYTIIKLSTTIHLLEFACDPVEHHGGHDGAVVKDCICSGIFSLEERVEVTNCRNY